MSEVLRLTVLVIGILFVVSNFYLLIKKRVGERTTIIWIIGVFLALLISAFPRILNRVADLVGVDYPPALLFLVAILILFFITIYQSMQIATLEQKLREVARTVALTNQIHAWQEIAASMESPDAVDTGGQEDA